MAIAYFPLIMLLGLAALHAPRTEPAPVQSESCWCAIDFVIVPGSCACTTYQLTNTLFILG